CARGSSGMTDLSLSDLAAAAGEVAGAGAEFVLLGMPDVHGSVRGKALRPEAFEAALAKGTVMTDLLLALDPTDEPITTYERFVASLVPALEGLGVELSAVHTEAGPGLLELNIAARDGARAADDAAYTKLAVKEVAAAMNLRASFLAKTAPGEEGSSGHVHL